MDKSYVIIPTIVAIQTGLDKMDSASHRETRRILKETIIESVIPAIENQYARGGDPSWEELSPATVIRRKRSAGVRIKRSKKRKTSSAVGLTKLIETGRLFRSTTSLGRWRIRPEEAVFNMQGQQPRYAIYHQTGTGRMPARNFAQLTNTDKQIISNTLETKILDTFKGPLW